MTLGQEQRMSTCAVLALCVSLTDWQLGAASLISSSIVWNKTSSEESNKFHFADHKWSNLSLLLQNRYVDWMSVTVLTVEKVDKETYLSACLLRHKLTSAEATDNCYRPAVTPSFVWLALITTTILIMLSQCLWCCNHNKVIATWTLRPCVDCHIHAPSHHHLWLPLPSKKGDTPSEGRSLINVGTTLKDALYAQLRHLATF